VTFEAALQATLAREGGFVLHEVDGDRGGQTYAGIARAMHPDWAGWLAIDRGDTPATQLVREFYLDKFWLPLRCDAMHDDVAKSLFDFGVNVGVATAAKLLQACVGAVPDGQIGAKTLAAVSTVPPELLRARLSLAKVARYAEIVKRNRSQGKFLLGWLSRTLEAA
jgi:lysozyme family protein